MPENSEITCRLLSASAVAYWAQRDGGLTACPLYGNVGYASEPVILDGGEDGIDAITVGSTIDGSVIVACRGTLSDSTAEDEEQVIDDWINNFYLKPVQVPELPDGCCAHDGFFKAVNLARSSDGRNVFEIVSEQLAAISDGAKLYTTGHSKGGAMSYIAAAQLIAKGRQPDAVISFAAARPGNKNLADYIQDKIAENRIRRYEVKNDMVPHLPLDLNILDFIDTAFKKDLGSFADWNYESVGQLYYYNMKGKLQVPQGITRAAVAVERMATLVNAIRKREFSQIVKEHSLTGSYGPLVCPGLPYDAAD